MKMQQAPEKRRYRRTHSDMRIRFTVLGHGEGTPELRSEVTGTIVDVTEGGVGLLTAFPVECGQILKFRSIVPEHGMVMWTSRIAGHSKAGLAFLHPAAVAEMVGDLPRPALLAL